MHVCAYFNPLRIKSTFLDMVLMVPSKILFAFFKLMSMHIKDSILLQMWWCLCERFLEIMNESWINVKNAMLLLLLSYSSLWAETSTPWRRYYTYRCGGVCVRVLEIMNESWICVKNAMLHLLLLLSYASLRAETSTPLHLKIGLISCIILLCRELDYVSYLGLVAFDFRLLSCILLLSREMDCGLL